MKAPKGKAIVKVRPDCICIQSVRTAKTQRFTSKDAARARMAQLAKRGIRVSVL